MSYIDPTSETNEVEPIYVKQEIKPYFFLSFLASIGRWSHRPLIGDLENIGH